MYPYLGWVRQCENVPITFPPQHQDRHPGIEAIMVPRPLSDNPRYQGSGKLQDKVAIITGGDSGIGRAVAIAFAKEGADSVLVYYDEHVDATETRQRVEQYGRRCLLIAGDIRDERLSQYTAQQTLETFGKIDTLVNNVAVQYPQESILDISAEQLRTTFEVNIFSFFYMTKAVLPYLQPRSTIINTASVTAYEGNTQLLDYSTTQGAVVTFTRSLSGSLVSQGIRVNGVAPGPIWTPLIPSSFSAQQVATFGTETPMKRAGQPYELAPAYVYLASEDSSYVTGQIIHVNGGTMTSS
ncbi:SDR family oxidoreductase [Brevibacillus humidisoli]|uniref:SDR family oxidoreductase n=1 Tax=Brevibacillus humidisoli TaxID=2895522 RepID=UPI001E3461C5|nr:SDR family oxidoreductase [Brevibacillus humidisoli]UFJ39868.1 SDR family oxidoreductase [Brevibacillus humidisoli]